MGIAIIHLKWQYEPLKKNKWKSGRLKYLYILLQTNVLIFILNIISTNMLNENEKCYIHILMQTKITVELR